MTKPLGFKILLQVPRVKEKMAGMFYIADDVRKKEQMGAEIGRVEAIGELAFSDKNYKEMPIKKGDYVYFRRYAGHTFENQSKKDFRLIYDEDIDAVADIEDVKISFDLIEDK